MSELKEVTIYTDGACIGNPGSGGYGVVLLYLNHRKELSGGFRHTTNNRMEIFAVLIGLQALKTRCKVTVYSDSQYVVDTMNLGWANKWRSNNWQRTKSEMAKNFDLWENLLTLCSQHEVKFIWIKGHANNVENERCDQLSIQAASSKDLAVDEVFESTLQPPPVSIDEPKPTSNKEQWKPKVKITYEGQPCRKCGEPVIKRIPNKKNQKDKAYTYAYYFFCPNPSCKTMYMVDEAKQVHVNTTSTANTKSLFDSVVETSVSPTVNNKTKLNSNQNITLRKKDTWIDDDPVLPPPVFLRDPRDSTAMLEKCPHGVLKIKKCAICDPEGFHANRGWD
jgi:ribonuclease HI